MTTHTYSPPTSRRGASIAADPAGESARAGEVASADAAKAQRVRIGFVVAVVGATVCGVEAAERLSSIVGKPGQSVEQLSMMALFVLVCWATRPNELRALRRAVHVR